MPPLHEFVRRRLGYKFPRLGSAANNLFFKLAPREIHTELFPGIHARLDSADLTQRTTYWQGDRFEYPTPSILAGWAAQSCTHFFDIGSNYGFFSYLILSRFKDIAVHAFEPNPSTFRLVEEIKTQNSLNNFHPHWMGLSDSKDTLFLHPGKTDSGHSTFGEHPALRDKSAVPIPVDTFDNWRKEAEISTPSTPAWIAKIDVEGFEPRVLRGMEQSLRLKSFVGLVVEVNRDTLAFSGSDREGIFSFMDSCGYRPTDPAQRSVDYGNVFFVPA